jgi:hypothetical protein
MMLVNADTIESPVTTVYRIAPKAAAAIVPMAYSTVDMPDSSVAKTVIRARNTRNMLITNTSSLLWSLLTSHSKPDCRTSPASPATTGAMPRHTNAGRKHNPSGPAISTPARSAAAAAACATS